MNAPRPPARPLPARLAAVNPSLVRVARKASGGDWNRVVVISRSRLEIFAEQVLCDLADAPIYLPPARPRAKPKARPRRELAAVDEFAAMEKTRHQVGKWIFTKHALQRMVDRGFDFQDVLTALNTPQVEIPDPYQSNARQRSADKTMVVFNPDTYEVITVKPSKAYEEHAG